MNKTFFSYKESMGDGVVFKHHLTRNKLFLNGIQVAPQEQSSCTSTAIKLHLDQNCSQILFTFFFRNYV